MQINGMTDAINTQLSGDQELMHANHVLFAEYRELTTAEQLAIKIQYGSVQAWGRENRPGYAAVRLAAEDRAGIRSQRTEEMRKALKTAQMKHQAKVCAAARKARNINLPAATALVKGLLPLHAVVGNMPESMMIRVKSINWKNLTVYSEVVSNEGFEYICDRGTKLAWKWRGGEDAMWGEGQAWIADDGKDDGMVMRLCNHSQNGLEGVIFEHGD